MASQIEPVVLPLENPEANYEKLKLELLSKAQIKTYTVNGTVETLPPIGSKIWTDPTKPVLFPYMSPGTYFELTTPEEFKWGFVYATGPADDTTARKWVVAFDYAAGKVYTESGPMGPVDWNVVEDRLGKSGSKSDFAEIYGQKAYVMFGKVAEIPIPS